MREEAAGSARVGQKRLAGMVVVQEYEAAAGVKFYRPGAAGPFPCLYWHGLWQLVQASPYRW